MSHLTACTLSALIVLGLTSVAEAARPPKDIVITSPPITGWYFTCQATNLSEQTLDVTLTVHGDNNTNQFDPETATLNIPASESRQLFYWFDSSPEWVISYCKATWNGSEADVRATLCSYSGTNFDFTPVGGCLELD